jgi:hypothetical protein
MKYAFSNHITLSKVRYDGVLAFSITLMLPHRKMAGTRNRTSYKVTVSCISIETHNAQQSYKTQTLNTYHVVSNFTFVSFREYWFSACPQFFEEGAVKNLAKKVNLILGMMHFHFCLLKDTLVVYSKVVNTVVQFYIYIFKCMPLSTGINFSL